MRKKADLFSIFCEQVEEHRYTSYLALHPLSIFVSSSEDLFLPLEVYLYLVHGGAMSSMLLRRLINASRQQARKHLSPPVLTGDALTLTDLTSADNTKTAEEEVVSYWIDALANLVTR